MSLWHEIGSCIWPKTELIVEKLIFQILKVGVMLGGKKADIFTIALYYPQNVNKMKGWIGRKIELRHFKR